MSRKLSEAKPQIADFEISLVRDKREKDLFFKNKERKIEISSTITRSQPGSKRSPVFNWLIEKKKRLVVLDEADTGIDRELRLKKLGCLDLSIEFTDYGPLLYSRDGQNVYKTTLFESPFYFIEIAPKEAIEILPKLSDEPATPNYFYSVYAVLTDVKPATIQVTSSTLLGELLNIDRYGQLFFGRNDGFDHELIDSVKIIEC